MRLIRNCQPSRFDRKAYQLRYRGEFNHITRSYDLVTQGNYANPAPEKFHRT
ncbi:MAG: hypothetical protein IPO53_00390 [Chitinophagaceae bacterium]|nr:hypothetical protein [Chitinophagaceae bacterium]